MVVHLVLPGIVVPTYRVRRYRPATGTGRRVHPWVQLVLPFEAEQGCGRRAYRDDVKRVLVWVVCLVGGTMLGYVAGRLHASTVPTCEDVCLLISRFLEEAERMKRVRLWTVVGFALGLAVAVVFQAWWRWEYNRPVSRSA